jgi:hypothetical protein
MTVAIAVVCREGVAVSEDSLVVTETSLRQVESRTQKLRFAGRAIIGPAFDARHSGVAELLFEDLAAGSAADGPHQIATKLSARAGAKEILLSFVVAGFREGRPMIFRKKYGQSVEQAFDRGYASAGETESEGPVAAVTIDEAAAYSRRFILDYINTARAAGQRPLAGEPIYTYISTRDAYWQVWR